VNTTLVHFLSKVPFLSLNDLLKMSEKEASVQRKTLRYLQKAPQNYFSRPLTLNYKNF